MPSVAIVEAALRLDAKQFSKTIEESKRAVANFGKDSRAAIGSLGIGLAAAGAGLGAFALDLKASADFADGLGDSLAGAFEGVTYDSVLSQVRELEALGAASGEGLVSAAKRFKLFGKDAAEALVEVADVSAKTGANFDKLAKSFAGFGKNSKDTEAFLKLANIDPSRLAQFGAVIDQTTGKLKITGDNGILAAQALEKLVSTDFAGSFEATQDATSHLSAELKLLKEDIGAGLVQVFDEAAAKLLPLAQGFRDLSAETKANIGNGIALASVVATGAAGFIGMGLAVTALRGSYAALVGGAKALQGTLITLAGAARTAVTAMAGFAGTPYIAALIAGGVAAKVLADKISSINQGLADQVKIEQEALDVELRRAQAAKDLGQFLGKSAQQLYDQGKLSTQVADAVGALKQRLSAAVAAGNESLKDQLAKQINDLTAVRDDLAKLEDRDRARVAARNAAADPAVAAANQAARDKEAAAEKAQRDADLQEKLDNIALELAKKEITQREALELERQALVQYEADQEKRRALAIETAKFESAEAAKAAQVAADKAEAIRSGKLQKELDRIELMRKENQISSNDEINLMKRVLQNFELTEDEKRNLILKTADLEKQQRDAKAAAAQAAAAQELQIEQQRAADLLAVRKQNVQDLLDAQDQARGLKGAALDNKVDDLQANTKETGKDNTGAITQAIREKFALDAEAIRLEADKAKAATQSAEARVQIEQNAAEQIRQLQRQATMDLKSELQEQTEAMLKAEQDRKKKRGEFTLGGTFGIQDLNSSIQADFARLPRFSEVASFELPSYSVPLPSAAITTSAVPNDPRLDKLVAAVEKLSTQRVEVDVAVADDRVKATAKSAPSGDGRQGSLVTTGRSTTRRG